VSILGLVLVIGIASGSFQHLPMRLGMNKKMFSSGSGRLFVVFMAPVGILGGDRAVVLGDVVVPFAPGLRGLRLFAMM